MTKTVRKSKGKPLRPAHEPEAHLQDGAGLPADAGAGDPETNTPRGSSGTARKASGTDGGTAPETADVGLQAGSPNLSIHAVRITAKRDGFRRAGLRHGVVPTTYPAGTFTPERLEQLLAEPELKVELI